MSRSEETGDGPETRSLSRRQFVKAAGATAIAGALLPIGMETGIAGAAPARAAGGRLSMAAFSAAVGQNFRVSLGSTRVILRLHRVVPVRPSVPRGTPPGHNAEAFSLVFHGPAHTPLSQNTYRFSHPGLRSFPLFIVPMAPKAGTLRYEAVFNRLPS